MKFIGQRIHKERAQPAQRKRLGLLEKHKDYVERARDFHKKQTIIHNLRRKAAFKNPDEFYFGMVKSKLQDGVHRELSTKTRTVQQVKQVKQTQLQYLNSIRVQELNKLERLKAEHPALEAAVATSTSSQPDHVIFATRGEELPSVPPPTPAGRKRHTRGRDDDEEEKRPTQEAEVIEDVDAEDGDELTPKIGGAVAGHHDANPKDTFAKAQRRLQRAEGLIRTLQTHMVSLEKGTKTKVEGPDGQTIYRFKPMRKR
ncbi:putative Small-subunit processome; Utp11 [Paratrimastix pyriformis]|uniref:U3 small nucleolar RNA-associated protein 11 n=1 Tax=Paratrimastix pyriformis TaxID=342808 RepID=A0ABQ8UAC1_9EUKA|nr:putative Small-subunit processome; Utp11 [Paratrimastix pyriformis]